MNGEDVLNITGYDLNRGLISLAVILILAIVLVIIVYRISDKPVRKHQVRKNAKAGRFQPEEPEESHVL